MKVTPLELRQRQFTTVMRGYDRAEVNTFLAQAADDVESLMLENDRLRQEAGKAEAALNEHRGQEKQLSNTLLTAQKIADDIREKAQHDAARFISEAEGRIAMMVDKHQSRVGEVQREIEALRAKRREVEVSLEGLIVTLNKTIESVRERDVQHEERTSLLLPRDGERRAEKPSVVLPLKEPSGPLSSSLSSSSSSSASSVTPVAPSPALAPASPAPPTPGPSVVVASTTTAPTSTPTPPANPTAPSTSAATPLSAPTPSPTTSTALTTASLVKPASATAPTRESAAPSTTPSRPNAEGLPARP
jgi:cell division initiation protein